MANDRPDIHLEWDGRITGYNKLVPIGIAEAFLQIGSRRIVRELQQEITRAGAVDSGTLLSSFETERGLSAIGPEIRVYSTAPYAMWVDKGTGIYGPTGSPIRPKSARVLKFNPGKRNSGSATPGVGRRKATNSFGKGGQFTGTVYAASVSGQKPVNFFEKVSSRMNMLWFV